MSSPRNARAWLPIAFGAAGFLLLAWATWKTAWVSEDAYITFRSVEQLFAGNGPRWNPHERVQAFTHPLWFFLLSLARVVTDNLFLGALVLGGLLTAAFFVLAARKAAKGEPLRLAALAGLAVTSQAFVDFSTGGLENPLAHVLAAVTVLFGLALSAADEQALPRNFTGVFLSAALLYLARPDAVLLAAPFMALALRDGLRAWGAKRTAVKLLGAITPAIAWTAFALVYYGAALPNTAYAKLATGIPLADRVAQGLYYFANALQWDPVTPGAIAAAIAIALRSRKTAPLGAALVAWSAYIVWTGGDFMAGRFFTPLFAASVVTLVMLAPAKVLVLAVAAAAAAFAVNPQTPLRFDWRRAQMSRQDAHGIADEKSYYPTNSLAAWREVHKRYAVFPQHPWALAGSAFRFNTSNITSLGNIGMYGYHAGVEKIIIDGLALTDPLLARLPSVPQWRVGHYPRKIPAGYYESLHGGDNQIRDPVVRALYSQVRLATQAPLSTPGRWAAIVRLNLGLYERPRAWDAYE